MSDRKPGLSIYERRYIAVLAAVVLVFVTVGIVMNVYQSGRRPEPMPVRAEELLFPDVTADTLGHNHVRERHRSQHGKRTDRHTSSKRKNGKSVKKQERPATTPVRDPVHASPIPAD